MEDSAEAEVPEDVPSDFEKEKLDGIKDQIELLGPFSASGTGPEGTQDASTTEPPEPVASGSGVQSEDAETDAVKKPVKNPKLNVRSGRDTDKKPTIRKQEDAEAAAPKKKKKNPASKSWGHCSSYT